MRALSCVDTGQESAELDRGCIYASAQTFREYPPDPYVVGSVAGPQRNQPLSARPIATQGGAPRRRLLTGSVDVFLAGE